jgi:hypothetical protein
MKRDDRAPGRVPMQGGWHCVPDFSCSVKESLGMFMSRDQWLIFSENKAVPGFAALLAALA